MRDREWKSDMEIDDIIQKQKKKGSLGMLLLIIGVVLLVPFAFAGSVFGMVVGIVIFGIGFYYRQQARQTIKDSMMEGAILPALRRVFEDVEYNPDRRISDGMIRDMNMKFDFRVDKIEGNDYVKARYHGIGIQMSDIRLITVDKENPDPEDYTVTEKEEFRGLWLICEFPRRFRTDLLLRDRKGLIDKLIKNEIKTEDAAFNRQFVIESGDEQTVFDILTPHMIEYIQDMKKKVNGRIYLRFRRDGKLCLALNTGKDFFEVGKFRKASAEVLREQFAQEIRFVTDLLDELLKIEALYG